MPKPDLVKVYADPKGKAYRDAGGGFTAIGFIPTTAPDPQREVLKRTALVFEADTALDIVSPDSYWTMSGDVINIPTAVDFLTKIQVYRNGQLLTSGAVDGPDVDVYFVDVDTVAFTFFIRPGEVLQIWKNFYT